MSIVSGKHMLRVWPMEPDPSPAARQMLTFKCERCRHGILYVNREDLSIMLLVKGYVPAFNQAAAVAFRAWGKCKEDDLPTTRT